MALIRTTFYPFRLVLSRKEPVQLTVDLTNDQKESRSYAIELEVGRGLSIERTGPKMNLYRMIGTLSPNEQKRIYYDIFAKAGTDESTIPIDLRIHELPKDAKGPHEVIQTFTRKLEIDVQSR